MIWATAVNRNRRLRAAPESLASRLARVAPRRHEERRAAAVIASPMPRRRHPGSVLTKKAYASEPNVRDPLVPRTTPSWSTAAKRRGSPGSDLRYAVSASGDS